MDFNDIHLIFGEKLSLFTFNFKRKQTADKIKYFKSLHDEYQFLRANHIGESEYGTDITDETYSISMHYRRYRVYLRKKRFEHLPNWLAILISLVSLAISVIM